MADSSTPTSVPHGMASAGSSDGILGSFVSAIANMIPALENIKATIEESSNAFPRVSSQLNSVNRATESATVEILDVLDSISQNVDAAEAGLKALGALLPNATQPVADTLQSISKTLATTKEKSLSIAMALQVQDITSQQIAGASHMIETVRLELVRLLNNFEGTAAPPQSTNSPLTGHFDTTAKYTGAGDRQAQADLIINQWTTGHHE